ncbi:MAG: hypothetical protein LVQ97_00065 [Candidatus Micrarchaeales archaeon]|jgi:type VI protein secretion system component VasK|uniref:Uncharacterized protein n=1 Tax=Candidatus Micrarchaeum acidiphilum ARMAN-2 TaxID=425595 RepID=C7DHA5_MICA2|nr:MAG: hypothetical protein UNLARM2_0451 [Candidatus Micrarchaeum acidiphilum ARMAN-2]MCW6160574.1 hypothetical protein [Candidatus Micrarchaeales archaeon]
MKAQFYFLAVLLLPAFSAAAFAGAPNSTQAYSNATALQSFNASFNSTVGYLTMVNQSSYLVFYPNLNRAYNLTYTAKKIYKEDPQLAYADLSEAKTLAARQLAYINQYQDVSFITLAVITAITAYLLYVIVYGSPKGRRKAKVM